VGENAVDVVIGIDLIEHLEDIAVTLGSILRTLRPWAFDFCMGTQSGRRHAASCDARLHGSDFHL